LSLVYRGNNTPNYTSAFHQELSSLQRHKIRMAQYISDIAYALSNCLSCFPGSPQLKINNRSFKILRLLGEVSPFPFDQLAIAILTRLPGRLLLRLPRTGYILRSNLRTQEDTMSLWSRIGCAGHERSRSLCTLYTTSQHHPRSRPLRRLRPIRPQRQNSIHSSSLLPSWKPPRHHKRKSSKPHQVSRTEIDGVVFGCL